MTQYTDIYSMLEKLNRSLQCVQRNDKEALVTSLIELSEEVLKQQKEIAKLQQDLYDAEAKCKNRGKVTLQQLTEKQGIIAWLFAHLYIDEQTVKIASLADTLQCEAHISIPHADTRHISETKGKMEQSKNYAQVVAQDQWLHGAAIQNEYSIL